MNYDPPRRNELFKIFSLIVKNSVKDYKKQTLDTLPRCVKIIKNAVKE